MSQYPFNDYGYMHGRTREEKERAESMREEDRNRLKQEYGRTITGKRVENVVVLGIISVLTGFLFWAGEKAYTGLRELIELRKQEIENVKRQIDGPVNRHYSTSRPK